MACPAAIEMNRKSEGTQIELASRCLRRESRNAGIQAPLGAEVRHLPRDLIHDLAGAELGELALEALPLRVEHRVRRSGVAMSFACPFVVRMAASVAMRP
jgi:hypothetical protein